MGNTNTIVAALDIGTTKICAIVARLTDYGKIEVLGVGKSTSEGVRRGVISNIDKTVYAIEEAVEEAKRRSGIDITNVYVGIAGQHIKSQKHRGYLMRNHDEQEIDLSDIERLVTDMYKLRLDPGEQIIHVLPQEFTIEGQPNIKDPIGMSGVRLEADFHVITGQDAAIKNINAPLNETQLMLLKLFSRPNTTKDTEAIRQLLLDYYHKALQAELDSVIEEKGITRTDYDKVLNQQQRTK